MATETNTPSTDHDPELGQTGLRLGLSTGALWPDHRTIEAPDVIASLDVPDVEIMLQNEGEYAPHFVAGLRRKLREAGLAVRSVHLRQGLHPLFDEDPAHLRQGRDLFERGIAVAADLGAGVLVWHGIERRFLDQADPAPVTRRFVSTTWELAEASHRAGVRLAIENVSWCILANVRDVVRLSGQLAAMPAELRPAFVFDPFQAAEADANPFMTLAAMDGNLADVHLSDYGDGDGAARHLLPGEGTLPWSALIRAIAIRYQGPMMLESPLGPEPVRSYQQARNVLVPLIRAARQITDEPTMPPPGVLEGIALFNAGAYFEAHETLEHEWHAERGPVRRLYQGILQIGVGFHHARNRNYRGAILLLTDGIAKVSDFTPRALGIETGRLVAESQACLDHIRALGPDRIAEFDVATAPRIQLTAEAALPVDEAS